MPTISYPSGPASGGGVSEATLASTANGDGASLVGVEDAAGRLAAADVEAALAEVTLDHDTLITDLAATTTGKGASLIGIEDAATLITATDVEGALTEHATAIAARTVAATLAATTTGNGASLVGVEDSGGNYTGTNVETVLAEIAASLGGTSISLAAVTIPGGDGDGNVGNLFSSPVTLVAAPASGSILVPVFFVIFYDFNSAAYDNSQNPDKLIIQYATGNVIAQTLTAGTSGRPLLNATADWMEVIQPGDNTASVGRAVASDAIELTYADADPYSAAGDSPLYVITGYYTLTPGP